MSDQEFEDDLEKIGISKEDKKARENSSPVWLLRVYSELVTDMLADHAMSWQEAAENAEEEADKEQYNRISQEFWQAADDVYYIQRRLGLVD